MKLVVHISDPHFGSQDTHIAATLLDEIDQLDPVCVVVSGDLTQRGRRAQFKQARRWLDALGRPCVVVPGNHDIPLYDVFTRFVRPRERYLRYITNDLAPRFVDDTIAIAGVDTTKRFTTKHGEIDRDKIDASLAELAELPGHWKLLVAHHPFIVPPDSKERTVAGAADVLPLLEDAGLDMILTGHLHLPFSAGRNERHTIIHVQAGTCISTRTRGEPNGYNQLRFEADEVTIVHRDWDGTQFIDRGSKRYGRGERERIVKLVDITPAPVSAGDRG
jgi:3',5'-cyclic AMP phosphodiesterase CpdA